MSADQLYSAHVLLRDRCFISPSSSLSSQPATSAAALLDRSVRIVGAVNAATSPSPTSFPEISSRSYSCPNVLQQRRETQAENDTSDDTQRVVKHPGGRQGLLDGESQ